MTYAIQSYLIFKCYRTSKGSDQFLIFFLFGSHPYYFLECGLDRPGGACLHIYIHLHVTGEIKTEGELAMEILAYSILAAFDLLLLCITAIVVVRVRQRMLTTFKSSKHIRNRER